MIIIWTPSTNQTMWISPYRNLILDEQNQQIFEYWNYKRLPIMHTPQDWWFLTNKYTPICTYRYFVRPVDHSDNFGMLSRYILLASFFISRIFLDSTGVSSWNLNKKRFRWFEYLVLCRSSDSGSKIVSLRPRSNPCRKSHFLYLLGSQTSI